MGNKFAANSVFYKGDGPMAVFFQPSGSDLTTFHLVYIRVHFRLLSGSNVNQNLVVSLDSFEGDEYDVTLFTAKSRGVGSDVNIVFSADERRSPSPWGFRPGDRIKFDWSGGSNIAWGLEVGYDS